MVFSMTFPPLRLHSPLGSTSRDTPTELSSSYFSSEYTERVMTLPNVPDPVNGMIKTYDANHRTFSRPYSAKTVFFYKDGDEHFTGVRLPVSKSRYRTIDSLLDDLNASLYLPYGVRRLTTPMGRHNIEELDQLQHMGKYVATSSKFARGVNLTALERLARARQQAHQNLQKERSGGTAFWVATSPTFKQKLRMSRSLGLSVLPSKQLFFVLNDQHKMYRTLLNPLRLPSMDMLLKEVSEGLGVAIFRLYSMEGKRLLHVSELLHLNPPRVIATPRSARPVLTEPTRFTLPPINDPKATAASRSIDRSLSSQVSSNDSNSIEKPRSQLATAIKRQTRRITGNAKARRQAAASQQLPPALAAPKSNGAVLTDASPRRRRLPLRTPAATTISVKAEKTGATTAAATAAVTAAAAVPISIITKKRRKKQTNHTLDKDDDDSGKATSNSSGASKADLSSSRTMGTDEDHESLLEVGRHVNGLHDDVTEEEGEGAAHNYRSQGGEEEKDAAQNYSNQREEEEDDEGDSSDYPENTAVAAAPAVNGHDSSRKSSNHQHIRDEHEERAKTTTIHRAGSSEESERDHIKAADEDEDAESEEEAGDEHRGTAEPSSSRADSYRAGESPVMTPLSPAMTSSRPASSAAPDGRPSSSRPVSAAAPESRQSRASRASSRQASRASSGAPDEPVLTPRDNTPLESRVSTRQSLRSVEERGLEHRESDEEEEERQRERTARLALAAGQSLHEEDEKRESRQASRVSVEEEGHEHRDSDEEDESRDRVGNLHGEETPRRQESRVSRQSVEENGLEHQESVEEAEIKPISRQTSSRMSVEERGLEYQQTFDLDQEQRMEDRQDGATPSTVHDDEHSSGDLSELKRQHEAATVIQAHIRGFLTRKHLKVELEPMPTAAEVHDLTSATKYDSEVILHDDDDRELTRVADTVGASPDYSTHSEPIDRTGSDMSYTIAVLTGNRWGADSEADLYVIADGDEHHGERFDLRQNETTMAKFRQNQLDAFHVRSPYLGTLEKIVVGHNRRGYGAGIFIEYILVTENVVDGRQFVFFVSKWLDSGQVDGKLERSLRVNAFYYVGSIPGDAVATRGRWEFIMHNGTAKGEGGSTAGLTIRGFGSSGTAVSSIGPDSSFFRVPSSTIIQVDFGDIGELLKVRFEMDGRGDRPEFYLGYVEMRDMDTEERLAVWVGKWFDPIGKKRKRPQSFREISIFRAGTQPLQMHNYEGKVYGSDLRLTASSTLQAQLIGDYSDSGVFPLTLNEEKKEYSFKVECVHLGRITGMRVYGDWTEVGEDVLDGLAILQDIYERRGMPDVAVGNGLLATAAVVRESTHYPYRYRLAEARVHELDGEWGRCKMLVFTEMEGMSTRFKKDRPTAHSDDWRLSVSLKERSPVVPKATLVVGQSDYDMEYLPENVDEEHPLLMYKLERQPRIGRIEKLRLSIENEAGVAGLHVVKMRLTNSLTSEEIRYPAANTTFDDASVVEFPAVYPDLAPKQNMLYTVAMETTASAGVFKPLLCIEGAASNSGWRAPPASLRSEFSPGSHDNFDIEAVDIGSPVLVRMRLETEELEASWIGEIRITSSTTPQAYIAAKVSVHANEARQFDLADESTL